MKKLIVIFLIFHCWSSVFAQNTYRTMEGHIVVSGKFQEKEFLAESHKLQITFNRSYSEVSGKISTRTFNSGIAVLDSILKSNSPEWLTFKGLVTIDFITWEHSEMEEAIPLTLSINGQDIPVQMSAKFTHLSGASTYACMLSGQFYLDISKFGFDNAPEGLNPELDVYFEQVVLRRQ